LSTTSVFIVFLYLLVTNTSSMFSYIYYKYLLMTKKELYIFKDKYSYYVAFINEKHKNNDKSLSRVFLY